MSRILGALVMASLLLVLLAVGSTIHSGINYLNHTFETAGAAQ